MTNANDLNQAVPAAPSEPVDVGRLRELMAKATQGPWHGDPEPYNEYVWGPNNEMVAQLRGTGANLPQGANGALIIAAVNALPELLALAASQSREVARLREVLETIEEFARGNGDVCEIIAKRARAALAALSQPSKKAEI